MIKIRICIIKSTYKKVIHILKRDLCIAWFLPNMVSSNTMHLIKFCIEMTPFCKLPLSSGKFSGQVCYQASTMPDDYSLSKYKSI